MARWTGVEVSNSGRGSADSSGNAEFRRWITDPVVDNAARSNRSLPTGADDADHRHPERDESGERRRDDEPTPETDVARLQDRVGPEQHDDQRDLEPYALASRQRVQAVEGRTKTAPRVAGEPGKPLARVSVPRMARGPSSNRSGRRTEAHAGGVRVSLCVLHAGRRGFAALLAKRREAEDGWRGVTDPPQTRDSGVVGWGQRARAEAQQKSTAIGVGEFGIDPPRGGDGLLRIDVPAARLVRLVLLLDRSRLCAPVRRVALGVVGARAPRRRYQRKQHHPHSRNGSTRQTASWPRRTSREEAALV